MKKIFIILTGIFISLLSIPIFAQEDPGDDPDLVAPIDDYIWVLAAIGLLFVFLKVRTIFKQTSNSQK